MATTTTWESLFAAGGSSSSSVSWQDVLKICLYEPRAQAGATQAHPLALMLFLLDGLSVLKCLGRDSQHPEHPLAGRDNGNDEEKAMTRSEVAEHFQIYLSELYLQAQEADSSAAPFQLTRNDLLSTALLRQAIPQAGEEGLSATSTDTFLDAVRSVCTECLDKLQHYRSSTSHQDLLELASANRAIRTSQDTSRTDNTSQISFSAVEATSNMLETILGGLSTLPTPDVSLQATLVQALSPSGGKEGRQRKGASASARRWILGTLLRHYLGDEAGFGQQTVHGSVQYASSTVDDAAVRAYFSRSGSASTPSSPPAISVSNPVNETRPKRSDSLKSTNTQVSLDPAAKAEAQQARRDDKLRWLFGENVSTKTLAIAKSYSSSTPTILSPSSPFAPPSPGKYSRLNHHRPEALRFPSSGMQGGDRAPLSPPHRRAWSAGSEGTFRTAGASPSEPSFSPALGGGFPRFPAVAAGSTQDILFAQQGGSRTALTGSSSSDDMASITTRNANDSSAGLGNSLTRFSSIDTTDSSTALLGAHRRIPSSGSGGAPMEIPYRGPFQSGLIRLDEGPEGSPPNAGLSTWGASGKGLNRSNSTSSVRSEPAFERREQLPLPPTVNVMTPKEKQSMVRKSRKLKAVLGEGVDEAQFMQLQQARGTATSPDANRVTKQRFIDEDDHTAADSSDMSRATSADLLSSMSRAGDLTDTFTSPDMALQSKSTLSKPTNGDEETATTPTAASHRSKDVADPPMSPSFSTSTSDNEPGSPAPHQTHFPTSPRKPGHKVRRTNSGRYDPEQQAKEARRRKLMKVQAFLGERVPFDALSEQAGPSKSPGSGKLKKDSSKRSTKLLSRASSTLISNKLGKTRPGLPAMNSKGSLSADDKERSPFPSLRGSRKDSRSRLSRAAFGSEGDEPLSSETGEWTYVQVDPTASPSGEQQSPATTNGSGAAAEDGVDPAITAIRRARKLEKVFGSLPPAQMYSARRPAYQAPSSSKKLVARDDRPAFLPSRSASFSANSLKSKSSTSSLYRQSLASLRYIANSGDPELIDGLAKLVLAEEDEGTDSEMEGNRTAKKNGKETKNVPTMMTDEDERKSILGDVSGTEDDEQLLAGKTASEAGDTQPRSSMDTNASNSGTFGHGPARGSVQSHARTGSALSTFSAFGTSPSGSNPRNPFTGSMYGPPSSSASGALYKAGRLGRESAMSGMTTHSSADSAYAFDGGLGGTGGHEGSPRSSMESVRIQFRRAHKLAKVFGTTRGEVFNKVLDDIEADMNEDEELDEDERRDVLENVAALRASL